MIIYLQTNTGIVEIPWKFGDPSPFADNSSVRNHVQDVIEVKIFTKEERYYDLIKSLPNFRFWLDCGHTDFARYFGDTAKFIAGNL